MSEQTKTVSGIVLREIRTKESDKIITVLTKELGIISIYAKGAMGLKNKFHSSTGLFTYSEFTVYESYQSQSKLYQLNEADLKSGFYKISQSIEWISLAMYMAEIACEVSVPDDATNDILRLFLNCLYMLCEGKWSVLLTKSAFEMRLMSDIGYRPDLVGCKRCGTYEKDIFFFDSESGQLVCPECKKSYDYGYVACEPSTTMALRYLALADLEKMFTFNLTGISLIRLGQISEKYVLSHTKDQYNTLDFLRPLLQPLIEKEIKSER